MKLKLAFLDVGNADCTVILPSEDRAIIIDVPQYRLVREWLLQNNIRHIESIYITHGYRDHLPSLSQLVTFLEQWFTACEGTLGTLYLPTEVMRHNPQLNDLLRAHNEEKYNKYRHAMDTLEEWEVDGRIAVDRSEQRPSGVQHGIVSIRALHPAPMYVERYLYQYPDNLNELSLVLRLEYGSFAALFSADIERDGLRKMLARCTDEDLRCHILKVPHHGAWQADTLATEELFMRAAPELAIVSVGSTNTYGHVQPGLFRALIQLQQTQMHRLQRFLCTEVTRTCTHTNEERAAMGKKGLPSKRPCAGTIVVEAEQSGRWLLPNEAAYDAQADSVKLAACRGRADLAGEAKP